MWQSAERIKAALIPLLLLVIVGFMMLLVSISTTKRMNSSLLDQLELSKSDMQISVETGEACGRDLEIKTEEINRRLEELDKLKRKNMKENSDNLKTKANLDESNRLLLQLLMQAKAEKQKLLSKINTLEKEILKQNIAFSIDETPQDDDIFKERKVNRAEDVKKNEIENKTKEEEGEGNLEEMLGIENAENKGVGLEQEVKENEEIQEYNPEEFIQTDQDYAPSYQYENYESSYV